MSVFTKIVTGIFGKKADRDMKILTPFIDEINAVFNSLKSLSDDELKERFQKIRNDFKEQSNIKNEEFKKAELKGGDLNNSINKAEEEFLDKKMVEIFAIVKDACRRLYGVEFTVMNQKMKWEMIPYDVQLIGGIALHQGKVAEMKTGEGKTLVSTMPIILNAIAGHGVHVITVNDYLAERDSQWKGLLYDYLGLSVGCILAQMNNEDRREI